MAGLLGGDPSQINLDAGGTSNILQGKLEEADHSSANWYFPKEELERNSPSLKDGIDARRETYFRKSYCTFVQDIGMRLKVPQLTIATAITFCHRFYLRQSHGRNDRFMIATVCMFLAGKVEETPRSLREVIFVSYLAKNKKDPQAHIKIKQKEIYEQQKDLVLYGERLVLTTLGFDLNVHHPYRPLVAAIKRFKVAQHALAQVAWNFVNDGLRTSLCLQFKPHHIAAGAIFLAAKFLKVKLPHDGERSWWQEFDVTPRQLEEVSNQMLELYEQNRVAPAASNHDLILGEHRNIPDPNVDLDVQQHRPSSHVQNGYINHTTAVTKQQHREANATEEYPEHSNRRVQYPEHTEQYPENSRKLSEHVGEELQLDQEEGVGSNKKKREVASASASTVTALTTEEGEVQEHYHGGANKRQLHEDREHNNYRHNNEYHGNYHHQERGRNHVKDKEEREPKKSRHKYS